MKSLLVCLSMLVVSASLQADEPRKPEAAASVSAALVGEEVKQPLTLKTLTVMTFGPGGVLFLADPESAMVSAVTTGDTSPAGTGDVMVENLGDRIGSALGTSKDQIAVTDMKVNPASGQIYLAVTRGKGKGKDALPMVVRISREGKIADFALESLAFTQIKLPNAKNNQRQEAITGLGFVAGKLIVAGLSNEDFASTLRVLDYPFTTADQGAGVQIFHGAHGKLETHAPVQTFTSYKISNVDHLMAAYTCTPLVKLPLSDLKPGAKVKGTTIAELGNGNKPLDMIVYEKEGKDYVLLANNRRGVMKIPTNDFANAEAIEKRVSGTAGVKYETIAALKGVTQLDKLDDKRAVILSVDDKQSMTLKSIDLP